MYLNIKKFTDRMDAGEPCLGVAVTYGDLSITEAVASECDFVWLDLEHSPTNMESLVGHMIACRAAGVPSLVRVPSGEIGWIKRVLDSGAEGIILPQARSYEEIQRFVDACYYPPKGNRGFGPRRPSDYGRLGGDSYLEQANREIFVCAQVECKAIVEDLDQIVQIEGLDSLCLGPMDLSGSVNKLGQTSDPEVVDLIETTIKKGRDAGLYIGMGMGASVDFALKSIGQGVQWAQCGTDMELIVNGANKLFTDIKSQA